MKEIFTLTSEPTLLAPRYRKALRYFGFLLFFILFYLIFFSFAPGLEAGLFFIDDQLILAHVSREGWSLENLWAIWRFEPRPEYLPIRSTTFLIDYSLAKFLHLHPYLVMRTMSIFYLSLASLVVFLLFFDRHKIPILAGLLSILFAVHPSHTIPTIWIASRKDVLVTLFLLLVVYFHTRRKIFWGTLCYLLAFLSKQSAYGLVIWIVAFNFFYHTEKSRPNFSWWQDFRYTLIYSFPYLVILFAYFPLHMQLSSSHPEGLIFLWNKTFLLIKFYLAKTLWPYPITQYYLRPDGLSPLFTLLSWAFFVGGGFVLLILHRYNKISLFVVSNIFLAFALIQPYVIIHLVLYLNNAYTFCFIAPVLFLFFDGLLKIGKNPAFRLLLAGLMVFGIVSASFYDRFLAREFADPIRAFERNVELFPNENFIHTRLAHAAHTAGDTKRALLAYETALRLRLQRDRRISIDAFEGMLSICSEEIRLRCLERLDRLAAKNTTPYYCEQVARRVQKIPTLREESSIATVIPMTQCRKRYANRMEKILGPQEVEMPTPTPGEKTKKTPNK